MPDIKPEQEKQKEKKTCVHEMLHEGMDRAGDGLRNKGRVVVRVVFGVERVPVQCAVQPIVEELRRAHVDQEHLDEPLAVVQREVGEGMAHALATIPVCTDHVGIHGTACANGARCVWRVTLAMYVV